MHQYQKPTFNNSAQSKIQITGKLPKLPDDRNIQYPSLCGEPTTSRNRRKIITNYGMNVLSNPNNPNFNLFSRP